jgi:hypothetical protein
LLDESEENYTFNSKPSMRLVRTVNLR